MDRGQEPLSRGGGTSAAWIREGGATQHSLPPKPVEELRDRPLLQPDHELAQVGRVKAGGFESIHRAERRCEGAGAFRERPLELRKPPGPTRVA